MLIVLAKSISDKVVILAVLWKLLFRCLGWFCFFRSFCGNSGEFMLRDWELSETFDSFYVYVTLLSKKFIPVFLISCRERFSIYQLLYKENIISGYTFPSASWVTPVISEC